MLSVEEQQEYLIANTKYSKEWVKKLGHKKLFSIFMTTKKKTYTNRLENVHLKIKIITDEYMKILFEVENEKFEDMDFIIERIHETVSYETSILETIELIKKGRKKYGNDNTRIDKDNT